MGALDTNRELRLRSHSLGLCVATISLVLIAGLAAGPSAAASGGPLAGMWHRLNPRQNLAPEHEALACHRQSGSSDLAWACRYFKIPEPNLNFAWNTTTGRFEGADVTASWTCPVWFPTTVCASVVQVVEGNFVFNGTFSVLQDLVVTQIGAQQTLYVYWIDSFACPWFTSFDEALAANPFPLPFDGVNGPGGDCLVPG